MPLSTDNQDYNERHGDDNTKPTEKPAGPALGNMPLGKDADTSATENNFDSDNLKGKKVDGDPSTESDKPADVSDVEK